MRKKLLFSVLFLIMITLILFGVPNFIFAFNPEGTNAYVNASNSGIEDGTQSHPFNTIQEGINFAGVTGTVYVSAGRYNENLSVPKSLTLQGSGSGNTIIDGSLTGSVIHITSGSISVFIIDFTITNGDASMGGGIYSQYSSTITVEDCVISNNEAASGMYGGGIYNRGAMTIINSIIKNNHAEWNGGGIYNYNGTMEITDSQIINNSAVSNGGGIYSEAGNIEIIDSQIIDNSAGVSGGGIYNYSGSGKYAVTIHDSSIADNTAPDGAGAYDVSGGDTVYAQNNWWGSSNGPDGGIEDPDHPGTFADGSGDEIFGHVYFYPWLDSDPFGEGSEETVWVRTMPMTCYLVWVNEDNKFQFIFWYPYRDNNWVKIYDMSGKEVFSMDMPYDNPNLIVDLPNGTYTVKTFNVDPATPIQTFVIGK